MPDAHHRRAGGPEAPESTRHRSSLLLAALLVVATIAVFGQVHRFEFVTYDDAAYVTENPAVRSGLTWSGLAWSLGFHESNWHPLTWLSLMLDAEIGGTAPRVFHLTNLFWHVASSLTLFLALRRMTGAVWRSGVVALLFAVHPLHVESVAWIAERKDVLSTFFWFLALVAYAAYAERPGTRRYAWVAAAFAAGLLAKPMLVTLPATLLLLDIWPLGRLPLRWRTRGETAVVLRLVAEKVPLFALSAASAVLTVAAQRQGRAIGGVELYPLADRVGNATTSYAAYVGQMVWPFRLSFFYPHPRGSSDTALVLLAALLLAAATATAALLARRHAYVLVGWAWYVVTLVPVIGLVQVGIQARADRYTYVPLVGLFLVLVWGVTDLADRAVGRARIRRAALAVAGGAAVALLGAAAHVQAGYWHDSVRLYRRALDLKPDNYVAHNNLALALLQAGDLEGAVLHAREALRLAPWHPEPPITLGNALARQGKLDEAVAVYRDAIRARPEDPVLRSNLGAFLGEQGRLDEAAVLLREALRLNPGSADARRNLGVVLARQRRYDDAIVEFSEALRLDPSSTEIRSQLERARALGDAARR